MSFKWVQTDVSFTQQQNKTKQNKTKHQQKMNCVWSHHHPSSRFAQIYPIIMIMTTAVTWSSYTGIKYLTTNPDVV
jgi:hypothetical protein